jgi:hypothetical protein
MENGNNSAGVMDVYKNQGIKDEDITTWPISTLPAFFPSIPGIFPAPSYPFPA